MILIRLVTLVLALVLSGGTPLHNAHAHNDYAHDRPLLDALDEGFCSVEADVFLVDGELLVSHDRKGCRESRTLRGLYLAPLAARVKAGGGTVYAAGEGATPPAFWLLIDIKADGPRAHEQIEKQLGEFPGVFSRFEDGAVKPGAVTVVISGDCPRERIAGLARRASFVDGREEDLSASPPAATSLTPWVSMDWSSRFAWKGEGDMPAGNRKDLDDVVRRAHERGYLLRFWGAPDVPAVWRVQRDAGVDLINIDDLAAGAKVLREPSTPPK